MNLSLVTRRSSLGVTLALMFFCASAMAQVGNDPTRPPSGFGTGADVESVDTGGGMVLQSVMITPTSKAAIIGGVTVKLGEKYGDAVLVKVAENEVVLKSGTTSQVLKLYPGVEKRESAPAPVKTAPRRSKSGSKAVPPADGAASSG
jgi:MSHA biogenesis protein MshK